MADPPDTRLERLRAVAATSHLRSPLARWLSANHDEFEQMLQDYRPRWEALVEQFGADGLLTLPPDFAADAAVRRRTVKAAMRTWERVKVAVAKRALRKGPAVPPPVTTGQSTPRLAIQPARQISPAQPAPQPGNAPDGGLEDVLKAMESKQGQMPKPFK